LQLFLNIIYNDKQQQTKGENYMDADKYKSVIVDKKTYKILQAIAKKGFDLEVSLARACREAITSFAKQRKVN